MGAVKIVVSALLLTLAFPPFDIAPLVFVALVPLISVLVESTPRGAWRAGYLFGLIFASGQLHWLAQLTQKWTNSAWLALVPWFLATIAMACYFGLFCFLYQRSRAKGLIWLTPLLWAGVEVFRTYIPVLAFPWALLATPLWRYPLLIQPASFGTIYLISAWVFIVNQTTFFLLKRREYLGEVRTNLLLAVGLPVLSIALFYAPRSTRLVPVTLGQVGIDMAFENPTRVAIAIPRIVQRFESIAIADHSQLLVLSEGIAASQDDHSFFNFPLNPDLPILFGAQRQAGSHTVYQSAIGYDGVWRHADKTRLVIFGEFVPGRDFIPFLSAFGLPGGDLSAGTTGVKSMTLKGLTVGPLLCFEGLFSDLSYRQALNGADLIAIMSNDDWFMNSSAPHQLRSAAIWRAVETGLSVVRVGSLGYSFACDRRGCPIVSLPLGKSLAVTREIPISRASPWVVILPLFPLASVVGCLVTLSPKRRSKKPLPESCQA